MAGPGPTDSESTMTLHRGTHTQQPSPMPYHRYRAFPPIDLPDRTWPSAVHHPGSAVAVHRPA